MQVPRAARPLLLAGALALGAPLLEAQKSLPADSLELGRTYARWFMAGGTDSLLAVMRPDLIASLGGRAGVLDGQAMVATRAGAESGLIEERFVWRNGQRQYWRKMQMTVLEEPFLLRFVILEDGGIGGIGMGPASAAPPVDSGGAAIIKP